LTFNRPAAKLRSAARTGQRLRPICATNDVHLTIINLYSETAALQLIDCSDCRALVEQRLVASAVSVLGAPVPEDGFGTWWAAADGLLSDVVHLDFEAHEVDTILFKGLVDVGRQDAPIDGLVPYSRVAKAILAVLSVFSLIGAKPIAYNDLNGGKMVRAVVPVLDGELKLFSQSHNYLDWHCDATYRPIDHAEGGVSPSPIYLALLGMNVRPGHPQTDIMSIYDVLGGLTEDEIETGCQPNFLVESGAPWGVKITRRVPIFYRRALGKIEWALNMETIKPTSWAAKKVITKINSLLCSGVHFTPDMQNGDLLIVNNRLSLHKRDEFRAKYDGSDRYLLRLHATDRYDRGIAAKEGCPFLWT
jgi:Taurine catabolism dioxygenase TauD, TfdA family